MVVVDCFRSGVLEKNCCLDVVLKALYGVAMAFVVVHCTQVHGTLATFNALENKVGGGLIVMSYCCGYDRELTEKN